MDRWRPITKETITMAASVSAESQLAKRKMARHHIDILIWPLPPRTKPPVTTGITIGLVR